MIGNKDKIMYQINNLLKMYRNPCTFQILVISGIVDKLRNFVQSHLQV